MADHKHGEMDIKEQQKTFAAFVKYSTWVAAGSIGLLVFIGLVNG